LECVCKVHKVEGNKYWTTGESLYGGWNEKPEEFWPKKRIKRKATDEEVKEALVKEAKKRGFPAKKWTFYPNQREPYLNVDLSDQFVYSSRFDELTLLLGEVYEDGVWGVPVDVIPQIIIN